MVLGKGLLLLLQVMMLPPHPALLWPSCSPLPTPPAGN